MMWRAFVAVVSLVYELPTHRVQLNNIIYEVSQWSLQRAQWHSSCLPLTHGLLRQMMVREAADRSYEATCHIRAFICIALGS